MFLELEEMSNERAIGMLFPSSQTRLLNSHNETTHKKKKNMSREGKEAGNKKVPLEKNQSIKL